MISVQISDTISKDLKRTDYTTNNGVNDKFKSIISGEIVNHISGAVKAIIGGDIITRCERKSCEYFIYLAIRSIII